MAWVEMVSESAATGLLKEIYERPRPSGELSEVHKIFTLRPELMDVRHRFQDPITFGGSGLGRYREELIAVSISAVLGCRY